MPVRRLARRLGECHHARGKVAAEWGGPPVSYGGRQPAYGLLSNHSLSCAISSGFSRRFGGM